MAANQQLIIVALQGNPALATQAATDPTTVAATLSVPVLTLRTTPITITTLAGVNVWGFAKATAALAAFSAVAASGGINGAQASALLAILNGDGLNAADPQIAALAPAFVAFSGGALTPADVITALNTSSYPCGDVVQASDVTAALATITNTAAIENLRRWLSDGYTAASGLIDASVISSSPAPSHAAILAAFGS